HPYLQTLARSELCRQACRHRRPLCRSPAHAVVLSLDEKSQIQALDRTQPGLPIKPGRCQTMTHDYQRHGTTTLYAALSVLDAVVLGECMRRHRHREFIRSLNNVERQVPAGKLIMRCSTTTPRTSTPGCGPGLRVTLVGPSPSPRPRPPGSMRS